jgi:hypothetical protein
MDPKQAEEYKTILLAFDIESSIEHLPDFGITLLVQEGKVDEAVAVLGELYSLDDHIHESIMRCPACGSDDVKERELSVLLWFFILPGLFAMIQRKACGVPYRCRNCAHTYRLKL